MRRSLPATKILSTTFAFEVAHKHRRRPRTISLFVADGCVSVWGMDRIAPTMEAIARAG